MGAVRTSTLAALACALAGTHALAGPPEHQEIFGEIELEATGFAEAPQFIGQDRHGASIAGTATLLLEWDDGDIAFKFTPFARFDKADSERTHADIRESKVDYISGSWSATFGVDTVFWGTWILACPVSMA